MYVQCHGSGSFLHPYTILRASESVARLCGHSTGIPPTREIVDYSCTVVGTFSPEEHLKHLIKCQFSSVSCF